MKKFMLSILFVFVALQAAENSGFPVLRLPLMTGQNAIGEQLLLGDDAAWSNAALLTRYRTRSVAGIYHEQWLEDIQTNNIGIIMPAQNFTFGAQFNIQQIDNIEVREGPSLQPLSYTDAHYLYGKVSVGFMAMDNLSAGVSFKYLHEKIFSSGNDGYALDFAGHYRITEYGIEASAAILNLGSMGELGAETTSLPTTYAAAVQYDFSNLVNDVPATLYAEFKKSDNSDAIVSLGGQYIFAEVLALQAGYLLNSSEKSYTLGGQIRWQHYHFGAAWIPMNNDFGDRLSFSFLLHF
jgi:hypothetical protein